jgi:hypothetical protein
MKLELILSSTLSNKSSFNVAGTRRNPRSRLQARGGEVVPRNEPQKKVSIIKKIKKKEIKHTRNKTKKPRPNDSSLVFFGRRYDLGPKTRPSWCWCWWLSAIVVSVPSYPLLHSLLPSMLVPTWWSVGLGATVCGVCRVGSLPKIEHEPPPVARKCDGGSS